GFVGTLAWLALPVTALALGHKAPLAGFIGALMLGIIVLYLPFLQVRFATEGRMRALFELGAVRARFRRAPWAFAMALLLLLLFALPLYFMKIEMVPREAAWLPSLFFIVFMFPARLLSGWAYARSRRQPIPCHWFFRWTSRLALLPAAGFYVLVVYFSQYAAW